MTFPAFAAPGLVGDSADMADLSSSIETNAAGPKSAAQDGASAEQHSLKDQIEADRYLAAKTATRKPGLGIVLGRFKPPGAV